MHIQIVNFRLKDMDIPEFEALCDTLAPAFAAIAGASRLLAAIHTLGFVPVPTATLRLDGRSHHTVVLDMGPASVDGWLARLVSAELGSEPSAILDPETREVVLGPRRLPLGPREWGVLSCLWARPARVVDRSSLLEQVWGTDTERESNVLEVTMRALRRKLDAHASMIETVRGRGYRLRP